LLIETTILAELKSQLLTASTISPTEADPEIPRPHRRLNSEPFVSPNTTALDPRLLELERLTRSYSLPLLFTQFLRSLPAWLISFLFHLFIILILALIVFRPESQDSISLVLSTFLDSAREEGGVVTLVDPNQPIADDLLEKADSETNENPDATSAELQAEADAAELTVDPNPLTPLSDLATLRQRLGNSSGGPATFAARDPRLRQEIVEKSGGSTTSEAAVARGLRWLASVQNADGSWSLAKYANHRNPKNKGDAAATSLALLPFLGAGQTHEYGLYKHTVSRGLAWLIKHQRENGDLRFNFPGQAGMYAHGQGAICLCEAYAMTGDERFRIPAEKAIRFIEQAQHKGGGWRYEPGQAGDTSVFGWQLMALQSARVSSLGESLDPDIWRLADYYLDTASQRGGPRVPDGARYRYQPNEGRPTPPMTAEGLLCRMYLGWKRDDPRLMSGVQWLNQNHLPSPSDPNLYYWYYGTQTMHHYGGREWETWNRALRDMLVSMQETQGKFPGSWGPDDFVWGSKGERIYVTSLAICTLEVYYRHLPIFKPLDLD
jgi:hypothetical protein